MSSHENRDIVPKLFQAFTDFNKSADKLSTVYKQLVAKVPEQGLYDWCSLPYPYSLLIGALECIPGGVIIIDQECKVVVFNKTAQDLTGFSKKDVVEANFRPVLTDIFEETLKTTVSSYCQKHLLSGVDVEIYTAPVVNDSGSIIGAVGLLTELNEKGKQKNEVQTLKASALNLSPIFTAVGDIIINIAHKMRSPLSAIQLFAELLRQDLDTDKQEMVDDIVVGVHSLDAVLSNLMSFAQPMNPRFQEVDIIAILEESLLFAEPAIKQQSISLAKKYSHNELYCHGDLEQLKQVCFNLILNAIQAIPEGGKLSINASYTHNKKYVDMEIADNGCGIHDESMDRIFTPFFTTKEGGTGLGLCIVYRVIQAHQGSIQIDSARGRGTTVSIQLPTEQKT